MQFSKLTRRSSVSIISFTRIFFVVKVNPDNITGSVVRPDIFSCIELTMAIVFASVAGIAGREAISNFVDRFVPRVRNQSGGYRPGDVGSYRQPRASSHDNRMVNSQDWMKLSASIDGSLVTIVEEIRES